MIATREHIKKFIEQKKTFKNFLNIKNVNLFFDELIKIAKANELKIAAQDVVTAAASTDSMLNSLFDWNSTEESRLQYAAFLIDQISTLIDSNNNVYVVKKEA